MKCCCSIFFLLVFCLVVQAQTAPTLVLGAYGHSTHNGIGYIPTDSGELAYAPGFSYNVKTSTYQFDTTYGYGYNSSTGYSPYFLEVEQYDSFKNLLTDRTLRREAGGGWMDSLLYTYTYDANNNILTSARQMLNPVTGHWRNLEKHLYEYDSVNNLLKNRRLSWLRDSTWVDTMLDAYTYDANHNLLTHKWGHWYYTSPALNSYTYKEDSTYTNYYDTANRIISTYGVTMTGPLRAYWYVYDPTTSDLQFKINVGVHSPWGWIIRDSIWYYYDSYHNVKLENEPKAMYNEYTYDTSHNILLAIKSSWSNGPIPRFIPTSRTRRTYNNEHQVTTYKFDSWVDTATVTSAWKPIYYYRYYYKTPPPPPPTGIRQPATPESFIRLYPNPVNDILNVDIKQEKEQVTIAMIYDMAGRLQMQWQISLSIYSHSSVPVQQLAAGTYILCIKTENELLKERFTVTR